MTHCLFCLPVVICLWGAPLTSPAAGETPCQVTVECVEGGQCSCVFNHNGVVLPVIPLPNLVHLLRPPCVDHSSVTPAQSPLGPVWLPHVDHLQNHASGLWLLPWAGLLAWFRGLYGLARPRPKRDKGPNSPAANSKCRNILVLGTWCAAKC